MGNQVSDTFYRTVERPLYRMTNIMRRNLKEQLREAIYGGF